MIHKLKAPVYVSTNDKHLMCLKVFVELFNIFWEGQDLNILGYTKPSYSLGKRATFHSMGPQQPPEKWSNGLLEFFSSIDDDVLLYGAEDMAFYDHTNCFLINNLIQMMKKDSSIGRINLVDCCEDDKCHIENSPYYKVKFVKDMKDCSLYELVQRSKYKITGQLSLWNKSYLIRYLCKDQSPWDFEQDGSGKAKKDDEYRVLMIWCDDGHFPVSKKELFQAGAWENQSYWHHLVSPSLQAEIKKWNDKEKHLIKYFRP